MKNTMKSFSHTKNLTIKLVFLLTTFSLFGCDPGQPEVDSGVDVSGRAAPLSQKEFNALPPEQQYQVAGKLYGTFFRGITAEDFFDLNAGITNLKPRSSTFLSDTRRALSASLSVAELSAADALIEGLDSEGNASEADAKYSFDDDTRPDDNEKAMQIPLARIKEYPVSHDLYVQWMAYFLSNTIMYSPAVEMETTDTVDAQNMYRFLVTKLKDQAPVREMIRSNLPSLARWRVSRSSENHALEAYELYLGLFETEEDSVKGGIACKDFFLTDEDAGYVLSTTNIPNTEPQLVLDSFFITTCDDLYDVIAGHPLVIPRAAEVLVNYLFSGRSQEDRVAIINAIASSGAETYEEIFTAMIFSREYLLNTERPRSFEENLLPLLDTLKWHPAAAGTSTVGKPIFENIASSYRGSVFYLGNKGWHSMTLKIGRFPDVPLDALSFANYHKGIREQLLMNEGSYSGIQLNIPGLIYKGEGDDAETNVRDVISQMSLTDYINFLFLNTMQRKASAAEVDGLIAIYDGLNYLTTDLDGIKIIRQSTSNTSHDNIAEVTFDYISRLPEFYYFRALN
ncbi:MAG: hypothetical protein RQ982_05140 [Gammaproteobacteria bacterium]|nr:hypothetical protein [Gammaproteobacteria bacterium]